MNNFGVFLTCFNEKKAVEYSLKQLYLYYPDIKTYLVSDGGLDYSYLKNTYQNLATSVETDSLSFNREITNTNFLDSHFQDRIIFSVNETIARLKKAINYCNTEYILMMDPDVLIRGTLNIPKSSFLLGSLVNNGLPEALKELLSSIDGSIIINEWGATPGIFHTETFMDGCEILEKNNLIEQFAKTFYGIFAHDLLLPIIFALVGKRETFNPDIVECKRNPLWRTTSHPLVHQFKEYYE